MIISKLEKDHFEEYPFLKKSFFDLKKENPKLRLGFLLDVSVEQFKEIFNYEPYEIKSLNNKLYQLITKSKKVILKTKAGTNLELEIDSKKLKWINQDADLSTPSLQHSILAGEVYGCPINSNGTLVINGVMGGKFSKFGELENNPLIVKIENGTIILLNSKNEELVNDFLEHINSIENANRVGELGFGTNTVLKKFYGVIGIDEKFPGVHIAFGHPYSEKTGADWSSKTHIDCVLKDCDVWIDNKKILDNSKYLI
jgi:leucyl aminopeptidase (aminopeptidase T)